MSQQETPMTVVRASSALSADTDVAVGADLLVAPADVELAGAAVAEAAAALDSSVHASLEQAESPEARWHRYSMGVLIGLVAAILLWLATGTRGLATFALSDQAAAVKLPSFTVPALATVLICAAACALACVGLFVKGVPPRLRMVLNVLAGLGFVFGFLAWAAASGKQGLPFQVSNQFNGTMAYATPLIFGALCGVMGERSGVVNVAIEGQFLTAAFAAALVGTLTKSLVFGVLAAVVVGVLMGVLLALFSVKYLVDQVVLGVVLNLFASGLTGFLYSKVMATNGSAMNMSPVMKEIAIPGLSKIPFIGPIIFQQTILAYGSLVAIAVVWFLLYRTKWGLQVRAVGEHPEAAETVGLNVRAIRWQAVLVGAAFAGLGGAYFTVGSTGQFVKDMSAGQGFIALAALIMGRWKPGLAALMALFFGFVSQLAGQLQVLQTPMNAQFLLILPYIATIIAVAGLIGRVRAPKADGTNYVK